MYHDLFYDQMKPSKKVYAQIVRLRSHLSSYLTLINPAKKH